MRILRTILAASLLAISIFSPISQANLDYAEAKILEVTNEENRQIVDLMITEGQLEDSVVKEVEYGWDPELADPYLLEAGDKVIVNLYAYESSGQVIIEDTVRTVPVVVLTGIFLLLVLFVAGWHGLRSFLGLFASVILIVFFYLPQVLAGGNALLLSLVYGLVIMVIALLIAHGITKKSVSAFMGTAVTLVAILVVAYLFSDWAQLTGFVDEEIRFLAVDGLSFDYQGLLIGAMLLGALGVLDDVTVSQAAIVFELDDANKKFSFKDLFYRALNVGRDHIVSTVNTLALAYLATSLPLLLLLSEGVVPFRYFAQSEIMITEILRILVGSIGIVLSIPLTNYIACLMAKKDWFKKLPVGRSRPCSHSH